MSRRHLPLVLLTALLCAGTDAQAQQYPVMEKLAQKVVQKYQQSSCEQLAAEKAQPESAKKQHMQDRAVDVLHKDPEMRKAFIDRVAAPIANKMFECGMIP
jgi:outer membrane lipoprotein-sorting protein